MTKKPDSEPSYPAYMGCLGLKICPERTDDAPGYTEGYQKRQSKIAAKISVFLDNMLKTPSKGKKTTV